MADASSKPKNKIPRSDPAHWADPENLDSSWRHRSTCAARFVAPNSIVLDIGCGQMMIEERLPPGCTYVPADLVRRDERTILCDLNKDNYPPYSSATHITVLGVLEYVRDLRAFWAWLAGSNARVICSYVTLGMCRIPSRRKNGWVNDLTEYELTELAAEAGFRFVAAERMISDNTIFVFDPARPR